MPISFTAKLGRDAKTAPRRGNQLRQAHEMLAAMGADGFAERARIELLATGERAPKRDCSRIVTISRRKRHRSHGSWVRARTGIAAQLFISQSTVEYHLHKVFRKLGVKSVQMARRVLETGR